MDDTRSDLTHDQTKPQHEAKHPDRWQRDLNPDRLAGQNIGPASAERERPVPTAQDLKHLHELLPELADDELRQITILREGTRLEQGATYLDLADSRRAPFKAMGSMTTEAGQYVVPKDRTPYTLWNHLIGEEKPPR